MPKRKLTDPKSEALDAQHSLNPHPEAVVDPLFHNSDFFDPRDLVQVKYELLRRVRTDGGSVLQAAEEFGFSRPTYYKVQDAFDQEGLVGLIPQKRGPRGRHKLTPPIREFLQKSVVPGEPFRARALAKAVEEQFGVSLHPRTIERFLGRVQKKTL